MPLNQTLRITDEFVDMQIMVLDYEASTYHISKTTSLYITTEQYQLARQVFIAQEVGKTVQDCYAKILALTERNTDMYNTIVRKGEN